MIAAFLLTMMLSGCGKSNKLLEVIQLKLPPLPAHLKEDCKDPALRKGMTLRLATAETKAKFVRCKRKHRDTKKFYTTVREGYGA